MSQPSREWHTGALGDCWATSPRCVDFQNLAWKNRARATVIGALKRLLALSSDAGAREAIFRRIRRFDDRWDSFTRELMREMFDIEIGRYTYGAYRIDESIASGTRIGSFCSVGPSVRLGGANHPLSYVSTHPFLYLANRGFVAEDDEALLGEGNAPVLIEDDVWLGANAMVLPGVRIGRGAVVAGGAVVTTSVPPYAIVAGVPARVMRLRFPEEKAARLATIDWPAWSDERIRDHLDSFYDVDLFLERYDSGMAGSEG